MTGVRRRELHWCGEEMIATSRPRLELELSFAVVLMERRGKERSGSGR